MIDHPHVRSARIIPYKSQRMLLVETSLKLRPELPRYDAMKIEELSELVQKFVAANRDKIDTHMILSRDNDPPMTDLSFRKATRADLPAIIALLADDPLGAAREEFADPLPAAYVEAFEALDSDPSQLLAVATHGEQIIGTLQLSFIPGLSRRGAWRGQIESVRIAAGSRSEGIGEKMFRWAIAQCRARGCQLVQLTTDKSRADAHRFYDRLGFKASHIGYKLDLS